MTMPMLPGLMDPAASAVGPTLADILTDLDDLTMADLIASAEAAGFGGEPVEEVVEEEGAEEAAEEVVEEAAEEGEEAAADGEEVAEEADVEEVASQGFAQMTDWATSARETLASQLETLEEMKSAAEANVEAGADPDSIEPLVEKGNELLEQADEALTECLDAAKAEEAHPCAVAALKIERIARVFGKLVEQAATFAETTSAPEAGFNDEPAVKLWAERTAPKAGPLTLG